MDFHATIKDGALTFAPGVAFNFQKYKATHEGQRVLIAEDKDDRSMGQLRMYRAWLSSVAASTGNDEEELHTFLLEKCAPRAVVQIKGSKGVVEVEQIKRTSGGHSLSMDKLEMRDFMNRCSQLTGYPLPTPEELEQLGYLPR